MATKTRKRTQTQKPRNEAWMRARLDQSNRNLTRPGGTKYKRTVKYRTRMFED